jgi:hypothetical protein
MVYLQTIYELCFGEAYIEYFESCDFSRGFRIDKGHDLAYDVKMMTSQQRLSRIVTSTFL